MNELNWNIYTIMHGNRKVASIHNDGQCVIYSKKFMPYNLYLKPAADNNIDERINYWVKGYREKINFDDVNLFNHSLSNAFVDVSLRGKELTLQNKELLKPLDVAGDIGTPGVAPKAWIKKTISSFL